MAGWQSGYAAACKAVHSGSIPDSASSIMICMRKEKIFICPSGGIGRHKGLKIPR